MHVWEWASEGFEAFDKYGYKNGVEMDPPVPILSMEQYIRDQRGEKDRRYDKAKGFVCLVR